MQRANVLPAMCGTEKPQDHSQGPLKLHHSLTPRRRRSEGAWLHGGGGVGGVGEEGGRGAEIEVRRRKVMERGGGRSRKNRVCGCMVKVS